MKIDLYCATASAASSFFGATVLSSRWPTRVLSRQVPFVDLTSISIDPFLDVCVKSRTLHIGGCPQEYRKFRFYLEFDLWKVLSYSALLARQWIRCNSFPGETVQTVSRGQRSTPVDCEFSHWTSRWKTRSRRIVRGRHLRQSCLHQCANGSCRLFLPLRHLLMTGVGLDATARCLHWVQEASTPVAYLSLYEEWLAYQSSTTMSP